MGPKPDESARESDVLATFLGPTKPKPQLTAVHVSAEYLDRITPKGIPQAPPGKYPVPPGTVEFRVNPALTGDQRILEYSDGTLQPQGFTPPPEPSP